MRLQCWCGWCGADSVPTGDRVRRHVSLCDIMELELLHSIFARVTAVTGRLDRGTEPGAQPASQPAQQDTTLLDLTKRDKYLVGKKTSAGPKRGRGRITKRGGDSGYSSRMESGYSSHRDSHTPSPMRGPDRETGRGAGQGRDRVWLVCQAGILPARLLARSPRPPNNQLKSAVQELEWQEESQQQPANDDIVIKALPGKKERPGGGKSSDLRDLANITETMVEIQLEDTGEILTVDKKYIEKVSRLFIF